MHDAVSPSASSLSGRAALVQELYTVMPEYLKPRHEYFPSLSTKLRITPAFADAPRDGDITICYTFITHIKVLTHQHQCHCVPCHSSHRFQGVVGKEEVCCKSESCVLRYRMCSDSTVDLRQYAAILCVCESWSLSVLW